MTNTSLQTYDEIQYQSYPYQVSSPESLKTLGILFGMNPPDIETAKVLELGCAEGGNIIPHAAKYPNATFVGVDLSKVQIDSGKAHIKELGLKNIELKHCSITDIDKNFGKFDYIVCHGVISWVPDFVRKKIFEISSANLTPQGIAYISYNTLPGWNMVRAIRDMMLYHAKNFATSAEKVSQGRLLLDFVKESLEGQDTPYANVLRQEAALLANQTDHYLRHDHLEEDNKQFYFSEFMQEAAKHNLQYLSDCSLPSMYLGNMPQNAVEKLQGLNDIVRTEQYMDFITNRRFRSTLLCHNNITLTRQINNDDIKKFAMSLNVTPEKALSEIDINSNDNAKFFWNNNKDSNLASTSPGLKAILYTFAENIGNPLKFNDVVKKACEKVKAGQKDLVERDLIANAINLVIKGYVVLSLNSGNKDTINLDMPKVSDFTVYQATKTNYNWVTNHLHAAISINIFDKFAIQYMDGKNNKEQIISKLVDDVRNGKITMNKDGAKIEDEKDVKKELNAFYDNLIERFVQSSLFI